MSDIEPVPSDVRRGPRRVIVIAVLAALALVGGLVDRVPRPEGRASSAGALVSSMPVAAPATALSSTWFCAAGMATTEAVDGLVADGAVSVANAGVVDLKGTATVVPLDGDPVVIPLEVKARSRVRFPLRQALTANYASVLVELDGGEAVVEHDVSGPQGIATAPCASSASTRWYLAEGSTARDDSMRLVLYNPFPEDAIVDLSFATDQGRAVPSAFTGLVVKGGRLSVVKVEDHVRRRNNVSVTAVARTGRIVIDRLQMRGGAAKGVSLTLAAPSPGERWYFPEGLITEGIAERFHVYNPTTREAEVSVELSLDEGAAEPFDLTVPPGERVTVVTSDEERVPKNVGHAATVVSLNGVPIVAERSVTAVAPANRIGVEDTLGARRTAQRWAFAAGSATDTTDEVIVVLNPGPAPATVTVRGLAAASTSPSRPCRASRSSRVAAWPFVSPISSSATTCLSSSTRPPPSWSSAASTWSERPASR